MTGEQIRQSAKVIGEPVKRGVTLGPEQLGGGGAPVWETRPTCQSWQKKTPPPSFTAAVMGFHASMCSLVKMPGVWG